MYTLYDMDYQHGLCICIGCFYYTLGNIHPIFRSSLQAIQLLSVAKTSDIRTYGCEPLLKRFVEQMNTIGEVNTHHTILL